MLSKNIFARNVAILVGGTAFSQFLIALSLPILTRLYSAEDFSHLAVYMALMGIFTVIACLRFNLAISLPSDDEDGLSLTAVSLVSGLFFSILLSVPVAFYPREISVLIGRPSFEPYLWMVPFGVFLASNYTALQYWSARKRRFGLITRTKFSQAIGGAGSQLVAGAFHASPFGLIFGHMLFGGLGLFGLLRAVFKNEPNLINKLRFRRIGALIVAYKRFPLYSVPEALFNTAGIQVPVLVVAAYAVGPEAGYLMLAMRVLGLPMGLIGRSVSQVFLAEAPQKQRDGELSRFTRKATIALAKIGFFPLITAGVLSPYLFPYIFGVEWTRAGDLVLWMVPWFLMQFITAPVSVVLHVTGDLAAAMYLQFFGFVLRVASVVFAVFFVSDFVVEVYAISGFAFYCVYLCVIYAAVKKNDRLGGARDYR
ncbi:polysaccharide biosynthesis protein [Thauera aminoaromatica S2]|uniref:Polysaccharide biosynthesis protein n=1 Tax=Thauera aminoaromatica S2 TaxID=1234381 RepID=N6YS71_THASP|nr:polysaccharide biosynthesis protein [Thauera aminoaromatica S2]